MLVSLTLPYFFIHYIYILIFVCVHTDFNYHGYNCIYSAPVFLLAIKIPHIKP